MKHKVKKYLGLLIFPLMLTGCTLGGSKNTEKTYISLSDEMESIKKHNEEFYGTDE